MATNGVKQLARSQGGTEACSICGGTTFGPAPNGRLSRRGLPPRCLSCRSLERHRAGRAMMEMLRDRERFKSYSLLQFSDEQIVAKGWFRAVETVNMATPDAITPMAMNKADGDVDCIISSHVITRVSDCRAAIRELVRVLSPQGLAYLSYPNPGTRHVSSFWQFANPAQNGNYCILGTDFEPDLAKEADGAHVSAVQVIDPVTKDDDLVYIITKDFNWMRKIAKLNLNLRFLE